MNSVNFILIASYLGAAFAIGISSVGAGIGEGLIAANATRALMRQPKASESLLKTMLIGQALTETGAIFALVVALLLLFGGMTNSNGGWQMVASLFGAGLVIGIGSLGPALGNGYTGGHACKGIGRQPREVNLLTANMLIGQALSQTSAIFALVISMVLLYSTPAGDSIVKSFALVGAVFSMGFGTFGPGLGIGMVAAKAVEAISKFPKQSPLLTRTMFVGAAVAESTSIYSLVVAFLLIFVA